MTRPKTRSRPNHDPPVDWRSTTVDRWSGGGPPPLTAIDRRWPPLTGGPVVAPVTAGRPRGTTHVVTRGTTNDWYELAYE
ncbi:hypothetical protein Tco_0119936, partial [Tanacetum coccineum]